MLAQSIVDATGCMEAQTQLQGLHDFMALSEPVSDTCVPLGSHNAIVNSRTSLD